MRKMLKASFIVLVLLFLTIQLVKPLRTNPPIDPSREIGAVHPMPPVVSALLQRSCNDCHSNRTVWPWYSTVAPASWVVAHDVNDGREALNLSDWSAYTGEKRQKLAGKMCEEAKGREMPISQYALVHPSARLSATDVQALCSWTKQIAPQSGEEKEEGD
ncbi:MAG TPA: heme-binding domain-containing protein [Candidatus Angelobacter sp.]|nr:heme-binding domain-containing protein [Candidatus Angelobacter sp.]